MEGGGGEARQFPPPVSRVFPGKKEAEAPKTEFSYFRPERHNSYVLVLDSISYAGGGGGGGKRWESVRRALLVKRMNSLS